MLMKKQFLSKSVPRGTRTIWRYLGALFILFTFAVGNLWAAGTALADLNFSGITAAPSAYTYSTTNTPSYQASQGPSGDKRSCMLIGNGGKGQTPTIESTGPKTGEGKRWMAFCPAEDCDLEIVCTGNGKEFKLYDKNHYNAKTNVDATTSHVSKYTAGSKWSTWEIEGLKAGTWYVLSVTGSSSYVASMTFTATSSTPVCPETLTISSKDSKTAFTEGDAIELTAALAKGNGDISYQWYKGGTAEGNKLTGKNTNKLQIASCTTADEGSYYCVASKTSCDDAVNTSGFAITVEADTKCFNMPAITSKPADLAHVTVSGGTLSDVSTAKSVVMNAAGLKLDGNSVYLKVSLASASIVEGTKITVAWKDAGSGAGIALVNENLEHKVIDLTGISDAAGSISHTFTAAEAANYADEFIIHRNASGTGIYVNAITVEDCGAAVTKHTITLNYNDGVTDNGSIKVVHGNAATQPSDPERGKYTFLGWFVGDTDDAYVWSSAVNDDITLKAHWQDPWTISFDADGGSAVANITVKHNTKAEKPADPTKASHDFNGWYIGDTETQFDWDANVTQDYALKAHWLELVAKYDIEYYDGDTKIGTEPQVRVDQHPTATGIDTDKPLYTFVGWYLSSTLEGDPVNLNTVTPVEGLKIYGKWAKAYATSIDLKAAATGSDEYTDVLDAHNIAYELTNTSWDEGTDIYNGLKIKGVNSYIKFNLKKGQLLILTVGYATNDVKIEVNDVDQSFVSSTTALSYFNYYAETADVVITVTKTANQGTASSIRSITIRAPYQVSFDADGGDVVPPQYGYPSVMLPSASKGTDSFVGWFDGDTKVGEAGESYTPTADITLKAHWEAVSTDARLASITFSATGTLSPAFDPEVTSYTYTMPYGTAAIPTITGATSVSNKAQDPIIGDAAAAWGDAQTVKGVAQSGDKKTYTITMVKAPKDGVVIIHADIPSGTSADYAATGLYAGTGNSKNEGSSLKLGTNHYAGVNLSGSEIFKEGDILNIHVKTKNGFVKAPISTTNAVDGSGVIFTEERSFVVGDNFITLTSAFEEANSSSLYLVRTTAIDAECNPAVDYIEVTRAMNPVLTAITINGEDAVKGTGNTFTITLPEEGTDLAALTVVPTIIRNAPHATTPEAVISNEGAWKAGDNTYRVMDKDGDYTDYTITITLQGEAPAPVIATQPAGVAYCAGSEPTLEVVATGDELHYAWFKEAGETDEAVGEDAASYTIASAGTYYVIITNHVDGKLDKSVTSENAIVTLNTPASITIQPTDLKKQTEGANITLSVVAANATAYQWYSCDNKDKENPSLIPGADEAEYEFAAAAGFFYCEVTGLCGTIESNVAEVTIKRTAGCQYINATSGSQANLADGTIMYACGSDGKLSTGDNFATASDNAKSVDAGAVGSINKQYCVVKFPVDVEEITLYGYNGSNREVNNLCTGDAVGTDIKVNTAFTAFTKSKANDGNDRSMTIEFDEPFAKEKYLFIKYNSALEIYRICYTAALVEPKLPTLADQELCAGAAIAAFDATITNAAACEGTVSYKWFSTADTETPVATTAEFTPSTDGTYYVVVTHSAAGHITRTVQSDNLTVAHFDALTLVSNSGDVFQHMGTAATLSVVATGKNVAYVWYTCSNAAGDDAVAITPAETESSLTIASVAEGVQYYKVVISHDCDATTLSHVFKVEGWDQLEQVDVTESTVWDMNNVSASEINLASMTPSKQNVLLLLANIEGVNNNASFNSQALMFEGQRIGRTENNVKYVSGQYVQFNVTVPGMVSVTFASNGSAQRTILINGKQCSRTTNDGTYIKYDVAVEPGSVEIEDVQGYVRISKIEFKAEDNYHRTVNPSFLGTLCWTNNAVLGGATLYEFAGKDEYNKLVFDEVAENRLEAGKPYIFMPENGNTEIKLYNTDNEAALTEDQEPVNHMYGTITGKTLVPGVDDNMYYFSSNHIWAVKDFLVNITVPAYYCYIDYPAVLADQPAPAAPAPGRRRVTMGVQGEQVVTGVENLNASEQPVKLLINGQIFILRGEKLFDATGRLVK